MVCAEDVVSYFRSLKSYERIWIMCKLQHSCLPFELRFLGTCLEELGKKDFHELRQAENEANSAAEICLSELRKISNKNVQNKIILYLSMLHSHNYTCSNSLYKILCDSEEVNSFLKFETDNEDDSFEPLLMMYTLAINHPAFSCDQKQVLHNIFNIIQAEENKRSSLKRSVTQASVEHTDNMPYNNAPIQLQECQPHICTSPENTYPPHQLPNPSHLRTVPQPFTHELSIPMAEQISIGLPPPNFMRFPFPAAAWNPTTIPIVLTSTEQTSTTQTFMSRSSSPSLSNSPSRSSSPSAKIRPLSAPFIRSPQMAGPIPHQPASLPLSQTNVDPFGEMINKDMSAPPMTADPNFASQQLYRLTDEELSTLGMTEESIQQLRCVVVDKRPNNDDITSTHSVSKTVQNADTEVDPIQSAGLIYTTSVNVPANIPNAAPHQCLMCQSGQNNGQMNGFVSPGTVDIVSCIDHDMNMLRLESDAPSRNSNSSNSDATSSDHSSPPNTPMLAQNNYSKRNKNNGNNEWSNNNVNINGGNNNDERSNTGDSSSEEKNSTIPTSYQGRGRIVNSRGRPKNLNTYSRGRGNHRRRNENMNGNSEDMRKPQFSVGNNEGATYQYTANPVTAAVTNATYMPPHLIRSYTSFPVNSYIRPPYPTFPPSGEIVYHQYPPPGAFLSGPIPFSMVPPKLSCYNCGSQNHFANDCPELTLEEASKQGQYRLDYTPVEGSFTEK